MDWKRIESVIRRTALPMIVTEGVEEPLIIMPLATYENLIQTSAQMLEKEEEEILELPKPRTTISHSVIEVMDQQHLEPTVDTSHTVDAQGMPRQNPGFLRRGELENSPKISELSASERAMFGW